jgi:SAM-dependent methyltransferase
MQNVVFATRAEALAAPRAELLLTTCARCGFSFNGRFDPARMVYDARYDNDVPSAAFERYYREIAVGLAARHGITAGTVCDVGCGKGRFLEVFTDAVRGVSGLGIDPSCAPREATDASPVTLVSDVFRPEHVVVAPRLVVCRHTLEHIPDPVPFLRSIHTALAGAPDAPLFFEVPDLDWILAHGAFWDFCYEHCNYFTASSLAWALSAAGFIVDEVTTAFGGQYLHAHCRRGVATETVVDASAAVERCVRYAADERARVAEARDEAARAAATSACALWGMATKGVLFANLVDPDGTLLSGGVDINVKKQGRYAPVTAHTIREPAWLTSLGASPTVFVMNPNYADEIRAQCESLGVRARFVNV